MGALDIITLFCLAIILLTLGILISGFFHGTTGSS